MQNKYIAKGRELIEPRETWRNKGYSVFEYTRAAEKEGLKYYTRHWWNIIELHSALKYMIENR